MATGVTGARGCVYVLLCSGWSGTGSFGTKWTTSTPTVWCWTLIRARCAVPCRIAASRWVRACVLVCQCCGDGSRRRRRWRLLAVVTAVVVWPGGNVWMHVEVAWSQPRVLAEARFVGAEAAVAPLREKLAARLPLWYVPRRSFDA